MEQTIKVEVAAASAKKPMPRWKKLGIAGAAILCVVGLGVGLGVGLTRPKPGDNDDSSANQLWRPRIGMSWQIVLRNPIDNAVPTFTPDVQVWDIDLYENEAKTIRKLQKAGKKVICYFSAGTYESYRSDKDEFDKRDLGKTLDEWPDERWIRLSSPKVRSIMSRRIAVAASKGCDAIDPDNVDGFTHDNGLGLTKQDSIDFVKFLAKEARSHNMSTGLKNAGEIIDNVINDVDFCINEQCAEYRECRTFSKFIRAGKPVFQIEYPEGAPHVDDRVADEIFSRRGSAEGSGNFSTVIKTLDLDGWVRYDRGKIFKTILK